MATATTELFSFTVNGTEIKTEHEKLVASDILNLAERSGAIPNKPDNYRLETADEQHQFKSDDWVDLREHKAFITIPTESTDVAAANQ